MPKDGGTIPFVSDFIDFSIYIDADPAIIEKWYLARFMRLAEYGVSRSGRLLS